MEDVIEIYNVKIHNYPDGKPETEDGITFGDLEKSINFGTVRIFNSTQADFDKIDTSVDSHKILLTQDPLNSPYSGKNNKYYKLYKNENAKHYRTNQIYKFNLNTFNELLNLTISEYNKNLLSYKVLEDEYNIKEMIEYNGSYIRKIFTTQHDKIIIFGDFHGSFHTFFRTMLRLHIYGVLDIETYKIRDNYKLIFLGDIVDRGQYSLEIFEILFRFILNDKNNDKIIINRGNHEGTIDVSMRDGFMDETKSVSENEKLFYKMYDFFKLCPCATILHNNDTNKNYWLCHGYIPEKGSKDCNIKRLIKNDYDILIINQTMSSRIMWNDPSYITRTNKSIFKNAQSDRGGGYFFVGLERLNEFRHNTDIHFIVRGHNDSYDNACLFYNSRDKLEDGGTATSFFKLGNKIIYNKYKEYLSNLSTKLSLKDQYIDGSVENIFMNGDWSIVEQTNKSICKLYPILTISTNTDIDRSLTCDSFIVLHTTDITRNRNESILKITSIDIKDYLNTDNEENLLKTIETKPFLLEQSILKNDENFVSHAIKINPQVLEYSDLKNNENFVSREFIVNPQILEYINPNLRSKIQNQYKNKYIKYKFKYLKLKK